ncbi:MAG: nitroreductase family protein [Desulfurococcales archaeon]|nr:nitroreductase family protein [Desulfurococcales archaeon]
MRVLELARKRRSIRKYSAKPIPLENILYAIETALQAPSGANRQPWRFIIVNDPDIKMEIRKTAESWERKLHESDSTPEWFRKWLRERGITWRKEFLTTAPYLIVVIADRRAPYSRESVWLAVGYLLLALEEKGLASLTYTPTNPRAIASILGVPEYYTLETIIPVGLPGEDKVKEPRMRLEEAVYFNRWGSRRD